MSEALKSKAGVLPDIQFCFEDPQGERRLVLRYRLLDLEFAERWLYALQMRLDALDPFSSASNTDAISIRAEPRERYRLEPEDYSLFTPKREPGRIYVSYSGREVSPLKGFLTQSRVFPRPQIYYSTDCELYFGPERRFEKWAEFSRWVHDRGYDIQDPRLAVGEIAVAELVDPPKDLHEKRQTCTRLNGITLTARYRHRGRPLQRSPGKAVWPSPPLAILTIDLQGATSADLSFEISNTPSAKKWLKLLQSELARGTQTGTQLFGFDHNFGRWHLDFERPLRAEMDENDYPNFTPHRRRGELVLSNERMSESTLHLFWSGSTSRPLPPRELTASVVLNLNPDQEFFQMEALGKWLEERGLRASSPDLAIGELVIGRVLEDGRSLDEIAELLRRAPRVVAIRVTEFEAPGPRSDSESRQGIDFARPS